MLKPIRNMTVYISLATAILTYLRNDLLCTFTVQPMNNKTSITNIPEYINYRQPDLKTTITHKFVNLLIEVIIT